MRDGASAGLEADRTKIKIGLLKEAMQRALRRERMRFNLYDVDLHLVATPITTWLSQRETKRLPTACEMRSLHFTACTNTLSSNSLMCCSRLKRYLSTVFQSQRSESMVARGQALAFKGTPTSGRAAWRRPDPAELPPPA